MAEFYATYDQDGNHFLVVVIAPERPETLRFENRESLLAAMDSLGHTWRMEGEILGVVSDDWLERMAAWGAMKPVPKQTDSIFSFGSIPHMGW
jgi:hypothetical protein